MQLIPSDQIVRCRLIVIISIYNPARIFCTTRASMLDCGSRTVQS